MNPSTGAAFGPGATAGACSYPGAAYPGAA